MGGGVGFWRGLLFFAWSLSRFLVVDTHRMGGLTEVVRGALGKGVYHWFTSIGDLGRPKLRVFEPEPVGWGGYSRVMTVRYETRSSGRCCGSRISPMEPPPDVAEKSNTIIRRIYNKTVETERDSRYLTKFNIQHTIPEHTLYYTNPISHPESFSHSLDSESKSGQNRAR